MKGRVLFAACILLATGSSIFAVTAVSIEDNFFTPQNVTVPVGTTVKWTNNGAATHTATSGNGTPSGLFDSGNMTSGQTFQFTFNNPGTYPYYCKIHGAAMMSGTITVTCPTPSQLLLNPGFESGNTDWTSNPSTIINNTATFPARTGSWKAQLNGKGTTNTATLSQQIVIPSDACTAALTVYVRVSSKETTTAANDTMKVQVLNSSGQLLKTLKTYSNANKSSSYAKKSFDLIAYKGQTISIRFLGKENSSLKTTFLVDDSGVNITQ